MFSRRVARYVVWRHLVRLPRSDVSSQDHQPRTSRSKEQATWRVNTTHWSISDWWGRAQGLDSSRDVVSARNLYLKYPTWAVTLL